jgi:hypothetical protein
MEPSIHEFISRFKASGEHSQMAFCKRHGVSYHKFKYHWKRQQQVQAAPVGSGFIGLKVDISNSKIKPVEKVKETIVARLFSGSQLTLEVQGEFSARFLRELAGC